MDFKHKAFHFMRPQEADENKKGKFIGMRYSFLSVMQKSDTSKALHLRQMNECP